MLRVGYEEFEQCRGTFSECQFIMIFSADEMKGTSVRERSQVGRRGSQKAGLRSGFAY